MGAGEEGGGEQNPPSCTPHPSCSLTCCEVVVVMGGSGCSTSPLWDEFPCSSHQNCAKLPRYCSSCVLKVKLSSAGGLLGLVYMPLFAGCFFFRILKSKGQTHLCTCGTKVRFRLRQTNHLKTESTSIPYMLMSHVSFSF